MGHADEGDPWGTGTGFKPIHSATLREGGPAHPPTNISIDKLCVCGGGVGTAFGNPNIPSTEARALRPLPPLPPCTPTYTRTQMKVTPGGRGGSTHTPPPRKMKIDSLPSTPPPPCTHGLCVNIYRKIDNPPKSVAIDHSIPPVPILVWAEVNTVGGTDDAWVRCHQSTFTPPAHTHR